MVTVKATREGLVGQATASGYIIDGHVPFVALPCETVLRQPVLVTNHATGKSVKALVLDIGPHYTDDYAYVLRGARPKAETDGSNGAGIDLGEFVWNALGMTDNGPVEWTFL